MIRKISHAITLFVCSVLAVGALAAEEGGGTLDCARLDDASEEQHVIDGRLFAQAFGIGWFGPDYVREAIEAGPGDVNSRILLAARDARSLSIAGPDEEELERLLWLVEHHPGRPALWAIMPLYEPFHGPVAEIGALWLDHLEQCPESPTALWWASRFTHLTDRDEALSYLERGWELEPENPRWPGRLAALQSGVIVRTKDGSSSAAARVALSNFQAALELTDDGDRHPHLARAGRMAVEAGELDTAQALGEEMLQETDRGWNQGNMVHHGNIIVGRVALRRGDVAAAVDHLLAAGRTEGSPQLNSYGPNMALAAELLEHDERDAVLEYFDLCRGFWSLHRPDLDRWAETVEQGRSPDFGANLTF
jgi:tetratricopeptide (TPR) repeat protein